MKKAFLKKIMSGVFAGLTIITLLPLGACAEWLENSDATWSYTYGNARVIGWKNISGTWYHFSSKGIMEKGWIDDGGNWYYLNKSGAMQTGWICDKGKWYYFNYLGAMQRGWIRVAEKWYYLGNDGAMETGYLNISDKLYYFNECGELQQTEEDLFQGNGENSSNTTGSNTVYVDGLPKLPDNYPISVQAYAENKILELMNEKRIEAGLKPLILDDTLMKIARYKSNHMIQYNYFDHTTPESNNWTSWLDAIGYQYSTTGENIAYNNYDPVELFNQWWNSPEHKENMMKPSYNKVGIGVISGNGKCMGTQTFSD